jgi:2'-N-acetylparomamine deacetylase / 2'''-acetyl-6'''-hydroxyneomycin deacetylase
MPREFQHGKILVISPHSDDAAYSIGGLLQKSILESRVHLLTLFGRSNFTRKSGFARDWQSVTELRKREDSAFARRIGAELTYVDLPEAAIRIGTTSNAIFANAGSSARLVIPAKLRVQVKRLLDTLQPVCVFAPLGIGGHRDHLIARQLSTAEARNRKLPLFYYEDLPYAAEISRGALSAYAHAIDPGLRPARVPIHLAAKLNNLTLYRSQVGAAELEIVAAYARRSRNGPMERVWSASHAGLLRNLQT